MAYTLNTNDVFQMRTRALLFGQVVRTVMTFRVSTPSGAGQGIQALTEMTNFADSIVGWITLLRACQGSQVQYNQYVAQVVYPVRRAQVVVPISKNGSHPDAATTTSVAATITKLTDLATIRKLKQKLGQIGSVHIPGVPATVYDQGVLQTAYFTGPLTTFASALTLTVSSVATGAVGTPCLWHRNNPNTVSTDLTGAIAQQTLRVQRRRTVRVGE